MNKSRLNIILVSLLLLLVEITFANVKLASVFSNHMVLQADKPIVVWGTADVAELVTVEINCKKAISRTDINGKWQLELPAMKYGGPYDLKVSGDDTLVLKNVMIGEVWLCAGQSNMRMTVRGVINAKEEIANANYKKIRFLTVPLAGAETTQDSFDAQWQVCSQATVGELTAAGYFFGRKLHEELDVAVGLIDISYGGASITTFMDAETVKNTADTTAINMITRKRKEHNENADAEWKFSSQHFPSLSYNAMVHPIVPFNSKGVIWYQGETDVANPKSYISWFGDYVGMMREKFNDATMPFYFVQLAGFENQHNTNILPESWAKFRLAQEQCLKYPNTGMATAMDIGMKDNIHPKNKQEVGRRLALIALNKTYGKKEVVYKGPQLKSIKRKEKSLLLVFDHTEGGFKTSTPGKTVQGFSAVLTNGEIIDVEGKIISNNTIEIKGSTIKRLRYAHANYPFCSLYNSKGLPALPFDELIK